jgi:hypothetical protein
MQHASYVATYFAPSIALSVVHGYRLSSATVDLYAELLRIPLPDAMGAASDYEAAAWLGQWVLDAALASSTRNDRLSPPRGPVLDPFPGRPSASHGAIESPDRRRHSPYRTFESGPTLPDLMMRRRQLSVEDRNQFVSADGTIMLDYDDALEQGLRLRVNYHDSTNRQCAGTLLLRLGGVNNSFPPPVLAHVLHALTAVVPLGIAAMHASVGFAVVRVACPADAAAIMQLNGRVWFAPACAVCAVTPAGEARLLNTVVAVRSDGAGKRFPRHLLTVAHWATTKPVDAARRADAPNVVCDDVMPTSRPRYGA